jgi:hypothetical protein
MKSRWINHQGVEIFYVDFSSLWMDRDLLKAELEEVSLTVRRNPKATVLGLVDIRGTVLSMAMTVIIKGYARRMGQHIRKAAVIVNQVTVSKRNVLSAIARVGGREVVLFENVEEAKDWLVAHKQQ